MDLELIICAAGALREIHGLKTIKLYCPYFLGSRSDRKFGKGSVNYIKSVIGPIINSMNFDEVTVIDPHSDVLEACLNNFTKIDNVDLVKFAMADYLGDDYQSKFDTVELVSPDAGALKKVYNVAEAIGFNHNIVIAAKHRDIQTGRITHTEVPGLANIAAGKTFFILDDICDGGRTFTELVKSIRAERPVDQFNDEMVLIITHGIFSAGLKALAGDFNRVYCTNSYVDANSGEFSMHNDRYLHKLTQLDVF
jgi:ribose-phosphate pyrophosphokinase